MGVIALLDKEEGIVQLTHLARRLDQSAFAHLLLSTPCSTSRPLCYGESISLAEAWVPGPRTRQATILAVLSRHSGFDVYGWAEEPNQGQFPKTFVDTENLRRGCWLF